MEFQGSPLPGSRSDTTFKYHLGYEATPQPKDRKGQAVRSSSAQNLPKPAPLPRSAPSLTFSCSGEGPTDAGHRYFNEFVKAQRARE